MMEQEQLQQRIPEMEPLPCEGAAGLGLAQAGEEVALGDLTAAFQPLGEELEEMEPGYYSSTWQEGERQWT